MHTLNMLLECGVLTDIYKIITCTLLFDTLITYILDYLHIYMYCNHANNILPLVYTFKLTYVYRMLSPLLLDEAPSPQNVFSTPSLSKH